MHLPSIRADNCEAQRRVQRSDRRQRYHRHDRRCSCGGNNQNNTSTSRRQSLFTTNNCIVSSSNVVDVEDDNDEKYSHAHWPNPNIASTTTDNKSQCSSSCSSNKRKRSSSQTKSLQRRCRCHCRCKNRIKDSQQPTNNTTFATKTPSAKTDAVSGSAITKGVGFEGCDFVGQNNALLDSTPLLQAPKNIDIDNKQIKQNDCLATTTIKITPTLPPPTTTISVKLTNTPSKSNIKKQQQNQRSSDTSTTNKTQLFDDNQHLVRYLGSSNQLRNEQKATKVLGVVFFTFVILWTPFFVINFASGLIDLEGDQVVKWISISQWLGYLSSVINPVIYTVFNRDFRRAFRRLLLCQARRHSLQSRSFRASQLGPRSHATHLQADGFHYYGPTQQARSSLRRNSATGQSDNYSTRMLLRKVHLPENSCANNSVQTKDGKLLAVE